VRRLHDLTASEVVQQQGDIKTLQALAQEIADKFEENSNQHRDMMVAFEGLKSQRCLGPEQCRRLFTFIESDRRGRKAREAEAREESSQEG